MASRPGTSPPPTHGPGAGFAPVKRVLWEVLGLNLLVAAAKVVVGLSSHSISMVADGFHSTMDGMSNVIGLVGLSVAARPPDATHPYGHQKYETFATLGIGLLLLFASANVLKSAFARLVDGDAPQITTLSFAVMVATIGVNTGVTLYEGRMGRRLRSPLLLADAAHTRSDILVSTSVLAGLVAVKLGWPWMDAVVALAVVAFIAYTGWRVIQRASGVLADSAVVDARQVEGVALRVPGVRSCHKVRSRGDGQATYIDMHIQVDGALSLHDAHRIAHEVQDRIRDQLAIRDVIVHVEPHRAGRQDGPQTGRAG